MLLIKPGVRITGLRPEILLAAVVAERVYEAAGHEFIITACVAGKHMAGSLHYAGAAIDIRPRDVTADKIPAILATLKEALADDFDVLLEGDHIHIEFQPKQSL
jgi:hypothetical protein